MACLETISQPWRKARSVNQTSTSFVSKLATLTEPLAESAPGFTTSATSASVLEFGRPQSFTQNGLLLMPYGTGSGTFSLRVFGWEKGQYPNSVNQYTWFPTLLCELLCTLDSGNPGIASGFVVATELFCKSISLTYGNSNITISLTSPGVSTINATALLDMQGFQKQELTFSTGSSATDCNCLCRGL